MQRKRIMCCVYDTKHHNIKIPTAYGQEMVTIQYVAQMKMDEFNIWLKRVMATHTKELEDKNGN